MPERVRLPQMRVRRDAMFLKKTHRRLAGVFFQWIILSERQPDRRQPLPDRPSALALKALEDGR